MARIIVTTFGSIWGSQSLFLRQIVDKPINNVRRTFHAPPRSNLMWTGNLSQRLTALAVSSAFLPSVLRLSKSCNISLRDVRCAL